MKIDLTITRKKEGLNIVGKNEQRLKLDIPTAWHQVTFRQYLAYLKTNGDIIKIVALFTGLEEDTVRNAQIHNLSVITACLNFLKKPPTYLVPSTILGYRIASNLDTESIAQFADLQTIAGTFKQDDNIFNLEQFPLIVATYAVNPYDYKHAENIATKFFNAPCTEVLAVGNFTLLRLNALNRGIVPTSPPEDTLPNRLRQDLGNWLNNLASYIRYVIWKRSLPLNERNYLNGR